jgi:hypothetical protein
MRKFAIGSVILGGLLMVSNSASAEQNVVDVEQNKSVVNFHINEQADYYKVFQNGEILYQGVSPNFSDSLENEFEKYKVGIYKDNKLEEVVNLKVDNEEGSQDKVNKSLMIKEKDNLKEDIMSKKVDGNTLEAIITDEEVLLTWDALPDNDGKYEIFRDGEKIGQTKKLTFTDKKVKSGERYVYSVVGETEVNAKQKEAINKQLGDERLKKASKKELQEMYTVRGTLTSIVNTPSNTEEYLTKKETLLKGKKTEDKGNEFGIASFPGTSEWRNYIFRYTTFIPQESVEDPMPFNGTYLHGDDRSFDYFSNDYRTRVDVNAFLTWNDFTYDRYVGESLRCEDRACTDIIERDTAPKSGIEVIEDYSSSSKMQWRVKHDVGIPFGSIYPNINYYYEATLTSSPSLSISGAHDKAPSHEFYMATYASDDMVPLHLFSVDSEWDFAYLAPGTPQEYFSVSM